MIAIKDKKMPRYCAECFVDDCPHRSGAATRLIYQHEYDKPADCPLVENDELQTKLDKIEEIVNRELIAGKRNYKTCYQAFFEIVDVIQK